MVHNTQERMQDIDNPPQYICFSKWNVELTYISTWNWRYALKAMYDHD